MGRIPIHSLHNGISDSMILGLNRFFEVILRAQISDMDKKIAEYLISRGYTPAASSVSQVRLFFRIDRGLVMAVMVIDGRNLILSYEAHRAIRDKTIALFLNKGYTNVKLFSLFLTNNIMNFGAIAAREELSWIVDLKENRLCIFDNELADFDSLRAGLEGLLRQEDAGSRVTIARAASDFILRNKCPVTLALILINVLVFVILAFQGSASDPYFMSEHGAMSTDRVMANHEWYRLLTAMFLHFGPEHLLANMVALWVFGERAETALGKGRFLLLYFLSGYVGNGVSLLLSMLSGSAVISAGASGAVFGVIGALFSIVIKNRGKYGDLTGGRAVFMVIYSIFSGIATEGVDNGAHIGGLVAGLLLGFLMYKRENRQEQQQEGKLL